MKPKYNLILQKHRCSVLSQEWKEEELEILRVRGENINELEQKLCATKKERKHLKDLSVEEIANVIQEHTNKDVELVT